MINENRIIIIYNSCFHINIVSSVYFITLPSEVFFKGDPPIFLALTLPLTPFQCILINEFGKTFEIWNSGSNILVQNYPRNFLKTL